MCKQWSDSFGSWLCLGCFAWSYGCGVHERDPLDGSIDVSPDVVRVIDGGTTDATDDRSLDAPTDSFSDAATGPEGARHVFTASTGSNRFAWAIATNTDGTRLVIGDPSASDAPSGGAVTVYERVSPDSSWDTPYELVRPEGSVTFGGIVDISDDGQRIIVGDPNGQSGRGGLWLYERRGSWRVHQVVPSGERPGWGWHAAISADGRSVLGCRTNGGTECRVWSVPVQLSDGQIITDAIGAPLVDRALNIAPQRIGMANAGYVSCDPRQGGSLTWSARAGSEWTRTTIDSDGVYDFGMACAVAAGGEHLVVSDFASDTSTLRFYGNVDNALTEIQALPYPDDVGIFLSMSSDASRVVAASTGRLNVYQRVGTTWSLSREIPGNGARFFGDGSALSGDGRIVFAYAQVSGAPVVYEFEL